MKKRQHRTSRLGAIEREILNDLSAGDLFVGFLLSARSTRLMYKIARERAMHRYRTRLALGRLNEQGLIELSGERAHITRDGLFAIDHTIGKIRNMLKTKKWDHKWRIVSYDIPEESKYLRDIVRSILKRAGFIKLHHSVWVFPHECNELASLIQKETKLHKHILYGTLERIENETKLKELFFPS